MKATIFLSAMLIACGGTAPKTQQCQTLPEGKYKASYYRLTGDCPNIDDEVFPISSASTTEDPLVRDNCTQTFEYSGCNVILHRECRVYLEDGYTDISVNLVINPNTKRGIENAYVVDYDNFGFFQWACKSDYEVYLERLGDI